MATTIKSVSDLFASWEALLAKTSPTEADCKQMSVLEGKIEDTPASGLAEMQMKMRLVEWLLDQDSDEQAARVCKTMVRDVMRDMERQDPAPVRLAA